MGVKKADLLQKLDDEHRTFVHAFCKDEIDPILEARLRRKLLVVNISEKDLEFRVSFDDPLTMEVIEEEYPDWDIIVEDDTEANCKRLRFS